MHGPRHLADATLHAYRANDADSAQRAAVEQHLRGCERCRLALRRIEAGVALLHTLSPIEPDELRWRRMQARVRSRLEVAASEEATGLDVLLGRRWVTAGLAAAAAVALIVWLAPRPTSSPARAPTVVAAVPGDQVIQSGEALLEVTLASGAELKLSPESRVVAMNPKGPVTALDLDTGALDVLLPARPSGDERFEIRTPSFAAAARSRDFSVGHLADLRFVEVRDGEVDVIGDAFGEATVREGERRETRIRPQSEPEVVAPAPASSGRASRALRSRPTVSSEPPPVVLQSSAGETKIEVSGGPQDPLRRDWLAANDAYYQRRDLVEAISFAERVIARDGARPEAREAAQMICDARIALKQPRAAVEACSALLQNVQGEERRMVHYTLATIHRTQLDDCSAAIRHYDQALVFGGRSMLDDEVRLFRATCALRLGAVELAEHDIESLEARAGRLARPAELEALRRALTEKKAATKNE